MISKVSCPGPTLGRSDDGGVRRIIPLTLGWEDLPSASRSTATPSGQMLREPVPGVLLQCDGGWLLLDTGFNTALITDPALRRRFHGDPLVQPVLPGPGEPLEEALAAAGVDLADVHAVAVSHLHNDHAGGLKLLRGPGPGPRPAARAGLRPERHHRPGAERHLPDRLRRPAPGLAPGRRRHRDRPRRHRGPDRGPHPRPPELHRRPGPLGRRGRPRVRLRRRRPHREHRARAGRRRLRSTSSPRSPWPPSASSRRSRPSRGYRIVPGHDPVAWPALTAELATRWPT